MSFRINLVFDDKELMSIQDDVYRRTTTYRRINEDFPWMDMTDRPKERYGSSPISFSYDGSVPYNWDYNENTIELRAPDLRAPTVDPSRYTVNAQSYQDYRASLIAQPETPTSSRNLLRRMAASIIGGTND